jgi:hypothetical protein
LLGWVLCAKRESWVEVDNGESTSGRAHPFSAFVADIDLPHLLLRAYIVGYSDGPELSPQRLDLRWLALTDEPSAIFPGGQFSHAPTVATDSAKVTLAPP